MNPTIKGTVEAWESGELGRDEEYAAQGMSLKQMKQALSQATVEQQPKEDQA